jgi:hypothetical protein
MMELHGMEGIVNRTKDMSKSLGFLLVLCLNGWIIQTPLLHNAMLHYDPVYPLCHRPTLLTKSQVAYDHLNFIRFRLQEQS